jgi:hypothetical protein
LSTPCRHAGPRDQAEDLVFRLLQDAELGEDERTTALLLLTEDCGIHIWRAAATPSRPEVHASPHAQWSRGPLTACFAATTVADGMALPVISG